MKTEPLKITVHMACSLDGFIAKQNGDVSWMETSDTYDKGIVEDNVEELLAAIDCYVIGSKTYETALRLGWPYGDKPTVVLTRRNLPLEKASVELYSGDIATFVKEKLKAKYKNVWLCGGSALTREFLNLGLVDEICLSILPVLIGNGIPFFDNIGKHQALHLENVKAYRSGIVALWYAVK